MKKIFTLATVLAISIGAFADRPAGKITITNNGKRDIIVEVDGRSFRQADQVYDFYNMQPGLHTVRIFEQRRKSPWIGVIGVMGSNKLIYDNRVFVKPRVSLEITVSRSGRIILDEHRLGHWGDRDDDRYDRDRGRHDHNDDRYGDNRGDDGYDFDNRAPYYREMDSRNFENFMNTLRRESFDNARLAIARQSVQGKYFSSRQVMDILLLFSFDDKKLELAKILYGNTVDKENFYEVYNVFSFGRSKEELADFVRRYR